MNKYLAVLAIASAASFSSVAKSDDVADGKQLVPSGGCIGCHGADLSGNTIGGWVAYNITPDPIAGIGSWSNDEIAQYLKTGHVNGKAQAAGLMTNIITGVTSNMSDDDRSAIAAYLKSIPPANPNNETESRFSYTTSRADDLDDLRGVDYDPAKVTPARLYLGNCAACHGSDGSGSRGGFFPSLVSNSAVGASSANNLVKVILGGVSRDIGDEHYYMPAFGNHLSDQQVSDIANYVTANFGRASTTISAAEVKALRD